MKPDEALKIIGDWVSDETKKKEIRKYNFDRTVGSVDYSKKYD